MNEPIQNKKTRRRKNTGEDYINNKEFSIALAEHVKIVRNCRAEGSEEPQINDYIAKGLLQIAQGLARSPNFMSYSYRDDMIMDAVENCLNVVNNFNIDAPTRTGVPNAFGYFTQICYFAFLRRIQKEKKQAEIKQKLIEGSNLDCFADFGDDNTQIGDSMIERMRQRIDHHFYDEELCNMKGEEPLPKKRRGRPAKKLPEFGPLDEFLNAFKYDNCKHKKGAI